MGRLWLALALLVALVSTAAAKPACACRTEVLLPHPGATNVPTNARFWDIPASGITSTPDQRIQVYELAPHTTYELSSPHLSFTTGDGPDDTPPVDPRIGRVAITLGHTGAGGVHPLALLQIAGTFSPDTAIVRVTLTAPSGTSVVYTTPDQPSICDLALSFAPGNVDVSITAIDLAGNQSSPVTYNATAMVGDDDAGCYATTGTRCGGILIPIVLGAWLGGTIVFVWILTLIDAVRRRLRARATREAVALPAVEALARSVRLGAVLQLAALGALVAIAWNHDAMLEPVILTAPVLVIGAVVMARRVAAAGRVLRLASYDGATATVCRDDVRVTVGGKDASVRAAPWRVRRARQHAIPRASVDLK